MKFGKQGNQISPGIESKKRLEVGLIAITDYTEAQASYDLSETQFIEAENLNDLTKESLYVLTGKQFKNFTLGAKDKSHRA